MLKHLRKTILGIGVLTSTVASAAPHPPTFTAGSLIIPGGASWQDACGTVSRFGLVYNLLRAQPYWNSAVGGGAPLHIYYIVKPGKGSPNRCMPAWTVPNLSYAGGAAGAPPSTAGAPGYKSVGSWDDGCDIRVPDGPLGSSQPVSVINNATGLPATSSFQTINTTGLMGTVGAPGSVYPGYGQITIDALVTQVGFGGAPFVIDVADATRVLNVLKAATPIATDINGNTIDFSVFRNPGVCSGATGYSSTTLPGMEHHVNIFQANAPFSAMIGRDFDSIPPRLALLAQDVNNLSGKLTDNVLEQYLFDAGLTFPGAQGCPTGGELINKTVCGPSSSTLCCTTMTGHGQIYDLFDVKDVAMNRITETDVNGLVYPMVWAPHWEAGSGDTTAFSNLSSYLDSTTGFMGECASISSNEGSNTSGGTGPVTAHLALQMCHVTGGVCDTTTNFKSIERNPGVPGSGSRRRNCTDPVMVNHNSCVFYGYPDDLFSQPGDYTYTFDSGHVTGMQAYSSFAYQPGVLPLISYVNDLDVTKTASASAARPIIAADLHTRNKKDNNTSKANIVYLAGHDLSGTPAGTQLALETLLQLGAVSTPTTPPITVTEVSRTSPVIATISGQSAIVQGSYSVLSTPASILSVIAPIDLTNWVFPTIGGHMRARTTASVTTASSAYDQGTILFDAANGIPPSTPAGCATNFTTTCRTVFTTTDTPTSYTGYSVALHPTNHMFKDAEATNIGGSIITGGLWNLLGYKSLLSRVLSGSPDASLVYTPKLGGVDHSTAAVIGASSLAGTTRPQMLYFGAMDGMMHAFCADTTGACAGGLGKELWAFVPRTQLQNLITNTAKVDSSVRVMDMFGDFKATGNSSFHTLMWFVTSNNNPGFAAKAPAVYEMDITDPANPTLVWEYTMETPGTPKTPIRPRQRPDRRCRCGADQRRQPQRRVRADQQR